MDGPFVSRDPGIRDRRSRSGKALRLVVVSARTADWLGRGGQAADGLLKACRPMRIGRDSYPCCAAEPGHSSRTRRHRARRHVAGSSAVQPCGRARVTAKQCEFRSKAAAYLRFHQAACRRHRCAKGRARRCLLCRGPAGFGLPDERMVQQLVRGRPFFVVDLEGLVQEVARIRRDVVRHGGTTRRTNLYERGCGQDWSQGRADVGASLTRKMACIWVRFAQGCAPVSISTTRQPSDQMSALLVYVVCLTTSGAIQ